MRDAIQLGQVPREESAAKSGTHHSKVQAHVYCAALQRAYPDCHFVVARYNSGEYCVEIVFDDEDTKAITLAEMAASGLSFWDEQALEALKSKGFAER